VCRPGPIDRKADTANCSRTESSGRHGDFELVDGRSTTPDQDGVGLRHNQIRHLQAHVHARAQRQVKRKRVGATAHRRFIRLARLHGRFVLGAGRVEEDLDKEDAAPRYPRRAEYGGVHGLGIWRRKIGYDSRRTVNTSEHSGHRGSTVFLCRYLNSLALRGWPSCWSGLGLV
jgi:hypothetical protein